MDGRGQAHPRPLKGRAALLEPRRYREHRELQRIVNKEQGMMSNEKKYSISNKVKRENEKALP
jgi:hypothetical protein